MRCCVPAVGICLLTILASWSTADEFKSGPQPGTENKPTLIPGPFHPFNVTGERAGKFHCLVCRHGLNPVVAVFVRGPDELGKPLADLLKKLDDAVERHRDARLGSFVIFLNDDVSKEDEREALAKKLEDAAKGIELKHVVLSLDASAGPADWKIHPDASLTVVIYRRHVVLANHAFSEKKPLTEQEVEAVLKDVATLLAPSKKQESGVRKQESRSRN